MRRPLLDSVERRIIRESDSLFAESLKGLLAVSGLKRAYIFDKVGKWALTSNFEDSWWLEDPDFEEIDERRIEREPDTKIRPQEAYDANKSNLLSRKLKE